MTINILNWSREEWKAGVTHRLQNEGFYLRPYVMPGMEIEGATVKWRRAATAGSATILQRGMTPSPIMNSNTDAVSATFVDYEANDFYKTADENKGLGVAVGQVIQKNIGIALGKKFDAALLALLDADTTNITTQGDGSAAITPQDIITARDAVFDVGAGSYSYVCALPAKFMSQLQLYKEFSSSDYVGTDYPLQKAAGARVWQNITFVPMPSALFKVPSANQLDAYLFVREAIGCEMNKDYTIKPSYLPREKGWFFGGDMGMASQIILPEAVKRLRFATNVALARTGL